MMWKWISNQNNVDKWVWKWDNFFAYGSDSTIDKTLLILILTFKLK